MKPEIKAKWVNALRSGDYSQQSYGRLRTVNGYCCLGVLCDLYVQEHEDVAWDEDESLGVPKYGFQENYDFLPESVVKWAGLPNFDPYVEVPFEDSDGETYTEYGSLAGMNDNGVPFDKLADLIESQL